MQLGDLLNAEEVKTSDLKIGDNVFIYSFTGKYEKYTVLGFGEDKIVNGHKVKGIPYVNKFENNGTYTENPNNYIFENKIKRVIKE